MRAKKGSRISRFQCKYLYDLILLSGEPNEGRMSEATEAEAKGLRGAEAMVVAHFSRKPLEAISGFFRGDGPRFFFLYFFFFFFFFLPFTYDFFGYHSHFLYTVFLQMSLFLLLLLLENVLQRVTIYSRMGGIVGSRVRLQ